jgi:hypothetical protein
VPVVGGHAGITILPLLSQVWLLSMATSSIAWKDSQIAHDSAAMECWRNAASAQQQFGCFTRTDGQAGRPAQAVSTAAHCHILHAQIWLLWEALIPALVVCCRLFPQSPLVMRSGRHLQSGYR